MEFVSLTGSIFGIPWKVQRQNVLGSAPYRLLVDGEFYCTLQDPHDAFSEIEFLKCFLSHELSSTDYILK